MFVDKQELIAIFETEFWVESSHLTGWNRSLVANLQAAQRGEAEPPPPWPARVEKQ